MNWSQFIRKIRIKTPIDQVYEAWADRNKISTWFLKSAEQIHPADGRNMVKKGDKVEWRWHNYENPSEIEILEANGTDFICFTFGYGMEVSIDFQKEEEFTILTLKQYHIPIDEEAKINFHIGCRQAWSTWLMNLKSWLEYGICIHDTGLGAREDLFDFVNT